MARIYYNKEGWVCNRHPYNFEIDDECQFIDIDDDKAKASYQCTDGYAWKVENGDLVTSVYDKSIIENARINQLRELRRELFSAFDIYKTNIYFGIESGDTKAEILKWYNLALDLNEDAIYNPPQEIQKYVL